MPVPQRKGDPVLVSRDEGFRADASLDRVVPGLGGSEQRFLRRDAALLFRQRFACLVELLSNRGEFRFGSGAGAAAPTAIAAPNPVDAPVTSTNRSRC